MGRISKPQKSKKHKKMKAIDPFYVGDRVADRDAAKFNMAPKETEIEQEFSSSVKEIVRLKELAKTMKKRKRNQQTIDTNENLGANERGITRPSSPVPQFKRQKGEREEAFMNRVERVTQAVIHKAQFEDKYQIGELVEEVKSKKQNSNPDGISKKKRRLVEKKQTLLLKKLSKNEDKLEKALADPLIYDQMKQFQSEVKVQTSTLKPAKPRISKNHEPSVQADLSQQQKKVASELKKREVGKTIKSKFLTPAARQALEKEREKAIRLYREKKEQKNLLFQQQLDQEDNFDSL